MEIAQSGFGLIAIFALAWAFGENRTAGPWRVAALGIAAQLAVALVLFRVPALRGSFSALNDAVLALQHATDAGAGFVFGYLAGAPAPFETERPAASFILAFRALPLVIVISALTALLTYWRVLPQVVRAFAFVLRRTFGIGGAVGLGTAANIFVGMVEAPLFVRPYLDRMSRGDLFVVMTCGMATIAGTVMVVYATILEGVIADPLGHLLAASIISAPAAIAVARVMVPVDDDGPEPDDGASIRSEANGSMDAIARGTAAGLELYLRIVAMLLVLVALVSLVNGILTLLPDVGGAPLSLERALGWAMAPAAWLIGVPWAEAPIAGQLLGVKTVLNEFIAYVQLGELPDDALSARSRLIMAYALCGFANFGSLGIMIGGLTAMAPRRRDDIIALGPRTLVSGTLATLSTGAVVGIVA